MSRRVSDSAGPTSRLRAIPAAGADGVTGTPATDGLTTGPPAA